MMIKRKIIGVSIGCGIEFCRSKLVLIKKIKNIPTIILNKFSANAFLSTKFLM